MSGENFLAYFSSILRGFASSHLGVRFFRLSWDAAVPGRVLGVIGVFWVFDDHVFRVQVPNLGWLVLGKDSDGGLRGFLECRKYNSIISETGDVVCIEFHFVDGTSGIRTGEQEELVRRPAGLISFGLKADVVVQMIFMRVWMDGEIEMAELGGESVDVKRGRCLGRAAECGGGNHQRVAVFDDDQVYGEVGGAKSVFVWCGEM